MIVLLDTIFFALKYFENHSKKRCTLNSVSSSAALKCRVSRSTFSGSFLLVLLLIFPFSLHSYSGQIGSDSTVALSQSHIVFEGGDASNNRMARYALMANGFTLEDNNTTCSFDSIFPISKYLVLNGGTLRLTQDLNLSQYTAWGTGGTVFGNEGIISLASYPREYLLPVARDALSYVSQTNWPPYSSVSWSHDDTYIAAALTYMGNRGYIVIYEFIGVGLINRRLQYLGFGASNSVDFHPTSYDVAVGCDSAAGNELRVYRYTPPSTLTLVDSENLTANVTAVRWHSSGDYVAVGVSDHSVKIFSYNGSALTLTFSADQGPRTTINSMSWDSTGSYLVTGAEYAAVDNLYVYYFDAGAETLYLRDSVEVESGAVTAVDWLQSSSYIAVGTDSGVRRIKIYSYNESTDTLEEKLAAQDVDSQTPYGLSWKLDGTRLGAIFEQGVDSAIRTYYFDGEHETISILSDSGMITNEGLSIDWSHDGEHIATGDHGPGTLDSHVSIFKFVNSSPLVLDNLTLVCNGHVHLTDVLLFQGDCVIEGKRNKISLDTDGAIVIAPGASLTLKNVVLDGVEANRIVSQANNSSITLKESALKLSGNYTFSVGSIQFKQDVKISGTNIFSYESSQTSTIDFDTKLIFDHDTTFKYAPSIANRDLLYMEDETSQLILNGCTLRSTETGMRLTRGTLLLDNLVTFLCDGIAESESICFGDGTLENALTVDLLAAAELKVYGGFCSEG